MDHSLHSLVNTTQEEQKNFKLKLNIDKDKQIITSIVLCVIASIINIFTIIIKDYSNLSTGVKMGWDIYGAQDGFHWTINGDRNGDVDAYDRKPLYLTSGDITVYTRTAYNSTKETFHINKDMVQSKVPLNLKSYTVAEANALTNIDSGSLIWVSNGNAGAGTVAVHNGTDWKVLPYTNTIASS